MSVQPIPDGYTTVTPYLIVDNAAGYIVFLEEAFGVVPNHVTRNKDGAVAHAEIQLGTGRIMLASSGRGFDAAPASFYLYVEDCDALYSRALAAGATSIMEPADMFYGDRHGGVRDIAGNTWWIATHVKDVSGDEIDRLAAERG